MRDVLIATAFFAGVGSGTAQERAQDFSAVRTMLKKNCLACHSEKAKKGGLDLERFATEADVRKDLKPWQAMIEQLEAGEMPPKEKPQPTPEEKKQLLAWVRSFLDAEARARSGDPGLVPLRRLSNAEYDATIRDLTGVDLWPTREFPADGAAGEGFTNAAEALTDVSPALLTKYLNAAKGIADHAVLLPDGFRFSAGKTRREWTNERVTALREFYALYSPDGRLDIKSPLVATIVYREAITSGKVKLEDVVRQQGRNAKYFESLWTVLNDSTSSMPLDLIRARWRTATLKDVDVLLAEIAAWQTVLWKYVLIGSYRHGNATRQVANDPAGSVEQPRGSGSPDHKKQVQGYAEFRKIFPMFICFTEVIPTDEAVCLKMFHREDEPLIRLFLDDVEKARLDRLWAELRFVSQQPLAEHKYLPQFIGFVTQDQTKELLAFFESQRESFRKRAEAFEKELAAAAPKQMQSLIEYAARAWRRPLTEKEKSELLALHETLREKGLSHEDAFRGVVTRIFAAPAFLFRIESAPPGKDAAPVNDWELATRLSYFLWSSTPDVTLGHYASARMLRDPKNLASITDTMLKDLRVRRLAVAFGTQWLHVRGFDAHNEKSERLFPSFDVKLRTAMNEEAILFFQDLFQSNRSVRNILDADYTFLNETLAKHYGIPGVVGEHWRKVDGVKKYGRGGVLGFASVQATQSGAARTSPILRGNWVVETLLGEKLPRPPPDVPKLPDAEGGADKLTMRQLVERHTKNAECAVCHQRIDPFGFALEHYDPIGRRRDKDLSGLVVDAKAKLKDGTEFEGIDGLRSYLLKNKSDVITRLFCRRLLGYALGRSVALSDTTLLDEMVKELDTGGGVNAAVQAIVRSPQFRMVRGRDYDP